MALRFFWLNNVFSFIFGNNWREINLYNRKMIPGRVDTTENSSVTIYCGSSSPVTWTVLSIYYNYGGASVPDYSRHASGTNHLTLNQLVRQDTGTYYCAGTHLWENFTLGVFIAVYIAVPRGKVVPNWVEVTEGGAVTLTCSSYGPVEWFSVNFRSQNKTILHNTLSLINLKKEHSGPYACRGTHKVRGTKHLHIFHNAAIVIVDGVLHRVNSLNPRYPRNPWNQLMIQ